MIDYEQARAISETEFENLPVEGKNITELEPGQKWKLPRPAGSGLALTIAQNAVLSRRQKKLLVAVCADPSDVLRLEEEIRYFDPALKLYAFPDWETLPYDVLSPHSDLIGERLETLYLLQNRRHQDAEVDVLLVSATTAAQRLAPRQFLASTTFFFRKGQRIDPVEFKSRLVKAGYENVSQVVAPGEFASRGGIIDLYPMGSTEPYRLDFFDDELDEIHRLDPDTQRSTDEIKEVRLLPGHEFPMDPQARKDFCMRWRETFSGNPNSSNVYKDVENGIASPGLENYLPLFFDQTETLFDYIGSDASFMLVGDVEQAISQFDRETEGRATFLRAEGTNQILNLNLLYLNSEEFFLLCDQYARFAYPAPEKPEPGIRENASIDRKNTDPLHRLREYCEKASSGNERVLLLAGSPGRLETMNQLFREYRLEVRQVDSFEEFLGSSASVCIGFSTLYEGLEAPRLGFSVLTENEIYASSTRAVQRRRRRTEKESNIDLMIRDLSEVKIGDPVVHMTHGIGRYRGLVTMDMPDGEAEFLYIEYAKDTKLYVPVAQLHTISRYSGGDPEHAPLHALGRGEWEKVKSKAAKVVRDTAAELLNIYALRKARQGHAFKFSPTEYEAFCEAFPFEETEDQIKAIDAVADDMRSGKPMDRLVCGDVGFGKTEVALRAAFMAVMGGKQVAVLCPTTLLAEQHAQTFRDRFANFPVTVAELSRFRSSKETKATIGGLEMGTIDIVIGTHKLLSESVRFKDLGLVVIDEEHRFGVRQKERFKTLRAEVDVLTLTATPIPRTLSMSLEGMRDFSVIATAPQKRLSIKTFVQRDSASLIREAVLRELKRGGQVYFLHNEVETIQNCLERLQKIVPEARIGVAHGQMNERELEKVMKDFYAQKTNVLLCTTIIETGIDIPNANTIIIQRADKFGLAQLHQLRGRVGRSHHQAYAYLLTPGKDAITKNAEKRLQAIQDMEDLGSGFFLSMHDLEIRGAGEVLGENQSGLITGVGFDLYSQMLESAVKALKEGKEPELTKPLEATAEINLHASALLPKDYVQDVRQRLSFYKKLASSKEEVDTIRIQEEIADRFGALPEEARNLIVTHRIRILAGKLGIRKIDASRHGIVLTFVENPTLDVAKLFNLLQSRRDLKMTGPTQMTAEGDYETAEQRANAILQILKRLN